ncbi:MAG: SIS domain-containing protein [Deltaproteobacteria bacterium]|nr:SIS domain-containing protein [Deltaproteobacteria bacterium]MCZ6823071.1 SIS domain-containing protein [Deltaproteobacteria bacterium]
MSELEQEAGEALERFLRIAAREVKRVCADADRGAIAKAARLIREAEARGGRVHVTGVGKPEHIARYAAALLASTGTPATFLHATESVHGSVGQLRPADIVIAISNSGETRELLACVEVVRSFGAPLVAVTGHSDSALARAAEVVLEARVSEEGGPLELAPRASTLVELVVLAALSVELQASRGFSREDYNRRHPKGALGKRSAG